MAITAYISLISLTYCLMILSMYQINFSLALGVDQNRNHLVPIYQQDGQLNSFNEYIRQHHPFNQQQESSYDPTVLSDNNIASEPISRLNWFKRDLRLNKQANKRMLCFFHAVNCFG